MKKIKLKNMTKRTKITISLIAVLLLIIFWLINMFGDYSSITLKPNTKDIFSIKDLVMNDVKFGDKESDVYKKLGKAKSVKNTKKNTYKYKILNYKDTKITLRENYNDFIVVGVETTSNKYKFSRGVKIGQNVKKVMNKYKVSKKTGTYMYSNYTEEALKQSEITSNIYYGKRTSNVIKYVNRDSITSNITNIAQFSLEYKNGKIQKIIWSYDFN